MKNGLFAKQKERLLLERAELLKQIDFVNEQGQGIGSSWGILLENFQPMTIILQMSVRKCLNGARILLCGKAP